MRSPARNTLPTRQSRPPNVGCLRAFFALFMIFGLGVFYFATVRPLLQVVRASKWVETPCVVDSSNVAIVANRNDRHGITYRVDMTYHYTFLGFDYTSNQYQFDGGSSSGRNAKQAIVSQNPPGHRTVCYVNPEAPAESVINRGFQPVMVIGCIFLFFFAIGALGFCYAPRMARSQRVTQKNVVPVGEPTSGELVEIKPQFTPLTKFLMLLVFGLIWNGFVSVIVYLIFLSPHRQSSPLFAKIFIGFFALIGLVIIVSAFRKFLALFNPRLVLKTRTPAVPLGGELRFEWTLQGRTQKLHQLRIVLEGSEYATYNSGKNVHTTSQVFAEVPVVDVTDHDILAEGQGRVVVPAHLMHTFNGQRNRILWRLRVRGEIPRWPAIEEDYPIKVLPHSPTA